MRSDLAVNRESIDGIYTHSCMHATLACVASKAPDALEKVQVLQFELYVDGSRSTVNKTTEAVALEAVKMQLTGQTL